MACINLAKCHLNRVKGDGNPWSSSTVGAVLSVQSSPMNSVIKIILGNYHLHSHFLTRALLLYSPMALLFTGIEINVATNLCAGGPSMIMFIHRICMAFKGLGNFITVEMVIKERAAMLLQ